MTENKNQSSKTHFSRPVQMIAYVDAEHKRLTDIYDSATSQTELRFRMHKWLQSSTYSNVRVKYGPNRPLKTLGVQQTAPQFSKNACVSDRIPAEFSTFAENCLNLVGYVGIGTVFLAANTVAPWMTLFSLTSLAVFGNSRFLEHKKFFVQLISAVETAAVNTNPTSPIIINIDESAQTIRLYSVETQMWCELSLSYETEISAFLICATLPSGKSVKVSMDVMSVFFEAVINMVQ